MAWKLRKDKLKAGAPEAEASTPAAVPAAEEPEHAPVFDLSGSAFQTASPAVPDDEPEVPSFLDSEPILLPTGDVAHVEVPTPPRMDLRPLTDELEPLPIELEPLPIELEPLPTHHDFTREQADEPTFLPDPLPEFDPVIALPPHIEPEAIVVAPLTPRPKTEPEPLPTFETAPEPVPHADPGREAIAPGLVSLETETGLPKVAPFILDTPATPFVDETPRMRSVVIRIGKLSATHFLTKDVTTVGRPDSVTQNYPDIEIELDDGISRRHAEIRHIGSEYTIVDVGSTNGTLLNGERLTPNNPVTLQTGDRIRVGERTELQFRMTPLQILTNVVDISADPSIDAETASQAVLGARVTVQREENGFSYVGTDDRYQGWVASARLGPVWDDGDYFKTSIATLFAEVYDRPDAGSEMMTKLVVGTRVAVARRPEVDDWVPLLLPDRQVGYTHRLSLNMTHDGGLAGPSLLDEKARRAIDLHDLKRQIFQAVGLQATQVGRRLIGTPYLWGGCTPFGIDCSGFVQLAFKLSGVQLLRDAGLQFDDRRFAPAEGGAAFDEADFQTGDLVFFRRRADGPITHVGLALGGGRFIHSSGGLGVHIDPCDHPEYVAKYAGARRISADADLAIEAA